MDHVINANLKLNLTSPNIKPVVDSLERQLAGHNISVAISLKVNPNELKQLRDQIDLTRKSASELGKSFQENQRHITTFAESIGISARRFLSFGAAAAVLATLSYNIRNATVAALEFDRQLVRLKQVGVESRGELLQIEKTISHMGTSMGVSSKDMVEAAVTIKQAGFSARETAKALEVLGKTTLSPTFEDIKSTTEGLIAVTKQFNIQGRELENTFSAISKVSADFPVESTDIIEAIKRTGGAFKAAGGNINELIAMFTTIRGTTRESAESIATGMRTILARLQDPKVAQSLKGIGVKVYDIKDQFVGPMQAIERLSAAITKLPSGNIQVSQVLRDIGGLKQLSRIIPLIYNSDETKKAYQSALGSAGTLSKDAVTAQEALLVQTNKLKESFLDLFRVISTDSSVRTTLSFIISSVQTLTNLMRELKPLIPVFLAFTAAKTLSYGYKSFGQFKRGFVAPVSGYARGGSVFGGEAGKDSVPAMLMPGEFVLNKSAAQRIGYDRLNRVNKNYSYIQNRRKEMYGEDESLYGETWDENKKNTDYSSFYEYLMHAQQHHFNKLNRLKYDYRYHKNDRISEGYIKRKILNHKKNLRELIFEHTGYGARGILGEATPDIPLPQSDTETATFVSQRIGVLGNASDPTPLAKGIKTPTSSLEGRAIYDSVADRFVPPEGFAAGGIVGMQYFADGGEVKNRKLTDRQRYEIWLKNERLKEERRPPEGTSPSRGNILPTGPDYHGITHYTEVNDMANRIQKRIQSEKQRQIADNYQEMIKGVQTNPFENKSPKVADSGYLRPKVGYVGMGFSETDLPELRKNKGPIGVTPPTIRTPIESSTITMKDEDLHPLPSYPLAPYKERRRRELRDIKLPVLKTTPGRLGSIYPHYDPSDEGIFPFEDENKQVDKKRIQNSYYEGAIQGREFGRGQRRKLQEQRDFTAGHFGQGMNNDFISRTDAVTALINKSDEKLSKKLFPKFSEWLDNTKKWMNKTTSKTETLDAATGGSVVMKPQGRFGKFMSSRGGHMAMGGLALGAIAAPQIAEHVFGEKSKTAGVISGAATGALIGGSTMGVWGALIGGIGGVVLSLKQFSDELEQTRLKEMDTKLDSVKFKASGKFNSIGDANNLQDILQESIKSGTRPGEKKGFFGERFSIMKKAFGSATMGTNLEDARENNEYSRLNSMGDEDKQKISEKMKEMFTAMSKENPKLTYKEAAKNIESSGAIGKYKAGEILNLGGFKKVEDMHKFYAAQNKAAELQEKLNSILGQVNQEFQLTLSELEGFSAALQTGGEQFSTRQHYMDMGAAPLQGQVMSAPNNVTLGNLGKPGTIAGDINEFARQGGGYDTAFHQLDNIVRQVAPMNLGNADPEEAKLGLDTRKGNKAADIFKASGAGGNYNEKIAHALQAELNATPNLQEKLQTEGSRGIVEKVLQGFKPIKEAGESGNAEFQKTYQQHRQQHVNQLNRQFELSQERSGAELQKGEQANVFNSLRSQLSPDKVTSSNQAIGLIAPQRLTYRNPNRYKNNRFDYAINESFMGNREALSLEKPKKNQTRRNDKQLSELEGYASGEKAILSTKGDKFTQRNNIRTAFQGRFIGKEENSANQGIINANEALFKSQSALGAGGLSPEAIASKYKSNEARIDQLKTQRETARAGGANITELDKFDTEMENLQNSSRGLVKALENLRDNTTLASAAQKKYETAVQQFTADYDSRKKDADVLTFGSQGEKKDLLQRENITQQALSMNQEQFQSLPDQIKKVVFERLQETQGMSRSIQQYDKYGRERGVRDVDSETALNYFRQPALNQVTDSDSLRRSRGRAGQAIQQAENLTNNQNRAGEQLRNMKENNIGKQAIQGAESFDLYLTGLNQAFEKNQKATERFLQGSAELTKALNGFQGKLQIERNGKIEVILNGGALINAVKTDLQKEILETVVSKIQTEIQKGFKNQKAR